MVANARSTEREWRSLIERVTYSVNSARGTLTAVLCGVSINALYRWRPSKVRNMNQSDLESSNQPLRPLSLHQTKCLVEDRVTLTAKVSFCQRNKDVWGCLFIAVHFSIP